jgi:ATP-dependent protease ClpP protease subunit
MSAEKRKGSAFERALTIVHQRLRNARENADDIRKAATKLEVRFMDVVAIAIATEIGKELNPTQRSITGRCLPSARIRSALIIPVQQHFA